MKKTLVKSLAMAFVGSLLVAGSAMAVPLVGLTFNDNAGQTLTIWDGDAGDSNPLTGIVGYIGNIGSSWAVDVSTSGYGVPMIGSGTAPKLDLFSGLVTGGSGTMTVGVTQIDLGPLASGLTGFQTSIGGTTDGSVTLSSYYDNSNTAFGTGSLISTLGPLSGTAHFGQTTVVAGAPNSSLFSLTMLADITHSGQGQMTSFDAHLKPVPEPATMLLLGTGLVGLAGASRRKMASQA